MKVRVEQFEMTQNPVCREVEVVLRGRMQDADEAHSIYNSAMLRREVQLFSADFDRKQTSLCLDWFRDKREDLNIEKVIFNEPATIVYWADGTKTVVKCQEHDVFDKEKGLALCYMKKITGNKSGNFNKTLKEWLK